MTKPAACSALPELRILSRVVDDIRRCIGENPAEEGGILGGSPRDGVVTHFVSDASAIRTGVTYAPDYERLNTLLAEQWNPQGINLIGFVHSHPVGARHPSNGDLAYVAAILRANPE